MGYGHVIEKIHTSADKWDEIIKYVDDKLSDSKKLSALEKYEEAMEYVSQRLSDGDELVRVEYIEHADAIRGPVLQDDSWPYNSWTGRRTIQITLELRNDKAIAHHYEDMQDRVSRGGKWV